MSIRVAAIIDCDICTQSIAIDVTNFRNGDTEVDLVLAERGWWNRFDFTDICPAHPKPVPS